MTESLERMRTLAEDWERAGDRRCVFAAAYGTMTSNMVEAIEQGHFDDNPWVRRLLVRFAGYYFEAVERYETDSDGCPGVWRHALDACRQDLHPLQHLFLGINAHINYDLAFALADVLDDWSDLDETSRLRRRSDHLAVNDIIRQTVDVVQARIVEPIAPEMGTIDALLGPVDEWFFSRLIAGWRLAVWSNAVGLLESTETDRPSVVQRIEERALRTAELLDGLG